MQQKQSIVSRYFKGTFIGIGMLIPGVSGGTAAMICGVFEEIISSISNITKHLKTSLQALVPIALGGITSLLVFSKMINVLCSTVPTVMHVIFSILTLISTCFFIKNNIELKYSLSKFLTLMLGIIFSYGLLIFLNTFIYTNNNVSSYEYFILGFPLSAALILPGISFSYMLLVFGIYENVLSSLYIPQFNVILPLAFGVMFGTILFSKIFDIILKKHSQETYCFILGFIIISIFEPVIC